MLSQLLKDSYVILSVFPEAIEKASLGFGYFFDIYNPRLCFAASLHSGDFFSSKMHLKSES